MLIAIVVINTQIIFIAKPIDAMSLVDMLEAEYTMAFGAVATGNMNAYEHVTTDERTENFKDQLEICWVYY